MGFDMNYLYTLERLAEFLKNMGTWGLIRLAELFYLGTGLILKCPLGIFLKLPSG